MISGYPVSGNQHPVVVFQSDAGALEKQDPDERSDFGISSIQYLASSIQHPASSIQYPNPPKTPSSPFSPHSVYAFEVVAFYYRVWLNDCYCYYHCVAACFARVQGDSVFV